LYACKAKEQEEEGPTEEERHIHETETEDGICPCCGKNTTLPDDLTVGPYLGRLPPLSTSWDQAEYLDSIPDGVYRLLWMNNNQLPMFGHLLCKPASEPASEPSLNYLDWDGEILQRVSGVVGPIDILEKEKQEKYYAKWGTFILG
jgi:hypothetical protein